MSHLLENTHGVLQWDWVLHGEYSMVAVVVLVQEAGLGVQRLTAAQEALSCGQEAPRRMAEVQAWTGVWVLTEQTEGF